MSTTTYGKDQGWLPHYFDLDHVGFGFGGGVYRDPAAEYGTYNGHVGAWDTPDGGRKYGWEQNGQVYKEKFELDNDGSSIEVDALDASGGVTDDGSTFSIGAQANLGGVAVSREESDASSDEDRSVRVGMSAGEGFGARVHHGDKDGDGHREWGGGFDVGPVSFDYKTERPEELALAAIPGVGPLALMAMESNDRSDESEHYPTPEVCPTDALEVGGAGVSEVAEEYIPEVVETVEEVAEFVDDYAPTPSNVYSWLTED